VALDPQNVAAWRALGYFQLSGRWTTRKEALQKQGYIRHDGEWRLPQEVALIEKRRRTESAEREWFARLRLWRSQLSTKHYRDALSQIVSIRDPFAIRALASFLRREKHPRLRQLFVDVLGEVEDRRTLGVLVAIALHDTDEEVFHACVGKIVEKKSPDAVKLLTESLKHENNDQVNRAAYVLGRLGDPAAISPLIESLVTTHRVKAPGSAATTFSFGRTTTPTAPTTGASGVNSLHGAVALVQSETVGMRTPSGPTVVPIRVSNQCVLDALVELCDVSFGFDQNAWKNWLTLQQRYRQNNVQPRRE
jgi:hypothetical protein